MECSVYDPVGGSVALVAAGGRLASPVFAGPVVSHAFSHPGLHPQHVELLSAYWGRGSAGPSGHTAGMGDHSYVLRLHAGNGENEEMDRRAQ
jgi:hemoglobin